ncbi:MAG: 4-alpha-glucanotransferase [Nitrospira sp.]|nr:4-alpha-glucanotransferase [Nitrospira sp.]
MKSGRHPDKKTQLKNRSVSAGRSGLPTIDHAADSLHRLASSSGVATSYVDESGVRHQVSEHSLRRIFAVMGLQADTVDQVRMRLRESRTERWQEMLDRVMVVRESRLPRTFTVRLPVAADELGCLRIMWRLKLEEGEALAGRTAGGRLKVIEKAVVDGVAHHEVALPFPKVLPLGYHAFSLEAAAPSGTHHATMTIIVVPDCGYLHPCVMGDKRTWGLTIQLYGIRSRRNWGIGDFRDLAGMIRWAGAELGADFLGVNPLHALPPGQISPYSPSSRLFHHPLYLDIEGIPEYREARSLQARVKTPAFQARLASLRRSPMVQYAAVERMKWTALEALFRVFQRNHLARKTHRAAAFHRFVREQGDALVRFSLFRTLEEQMARRKGVAGTRLRGWRSWPEAYRHPDSTAVKRAAVRRFSRIQFFQYVEWQCQQQLLGIQTEASQAGMAIGLYKDMAVGIDPGGADAWAFQDQLVAEASIGTPPDLFSPNGQRWNLAPFHPRHIRTAAYRLFADCYRRAMQASGVIRIDHAMGLFRLFWIPDGLAPAEGTYVRYPSEDFLGVLALESQRQKVMVIGEDLGTVTPAIRAQLMAGGLLSYRLLLFEQTAKGQFAKPSRFPRHAAAAVATHDLPTLRGFWIGRDIELKAQLKLYTKPEWRIRDLATRKRDKQALLDALSKERLLPKECPRAADAVPRLTDELCRAIYAYLARTPSRLLILSLEDLLGDIETPNIPGDHAYPSWRLKAGPSGSTWEDWTKLDRALLMARVIREQRSQVKLRA